MGPTVVALITDFGFGDPGMLRYSLAIFAVAIAILAILCLWWGIGPYRVRAEAMLAEQSTTD